ncbi:VanZ family protein [Geothermobacter hydrogeniphilus]|uniref:VanZ family protein n=1 Tax=Geothermobacter hydrogeniphilus TaxID=1969733 RepID=UPI0011AF9B72|nr:VanZ family protein [Geothermobacter hydrogeniphilus]
MAAVRAADDRTARKRISFYQTEPMRPLKFQLRPILRTILGLYLVLLGVLSLMPNPPQPPDIISWDKLEHALAYAVLGPLLFVVLSPRLVNRVRLLWAAGIAWGTGAMFEFLQGVLKLGRCFEWSDLVANLVGTLTGLVLMHLVIIWLRRETRY